ncbi:hypothetical protein OG244_13490 [Streptomyces brevispora]|uniref:hypothetical protein n=1 Tax=Streptomyces brevispora TaxID=887462 RepID=UPI002E349309|nr:hypothetical protein [Streptomyces brevispora]
MKRTRAFTRVAGLLVAGLLTGVSGCSTPPDDPGASGRPEQAGSSTPRTERVSAPRERACRGGTYTWFNMQSHSVLNGVTDAQRVTTEPTKLSEPMQRLRTDQASLEAEGPGLDSRTVLFALGVRLGLVAQGDDPEGWAELGEPGSYAPLDAGGGEVSGHGARLVNFSAVTIIDADFRYACEGDEDREPTVGHLSTWGTTISGTLECGEPLPKDASAAAREAERLSCGR